MSAARKNTDKVTVVTIAISIVCALLVIGAICIWAPVCSGTLELANGNMTPMRCLYTGKIAILLSIALIVVCVASLITKRQLSVPIVVLSLAMMLLVVETPVSIGVCKNSEMACWSTAVWIAGCGGVSTVSAIIGFVLNPDRKRIQA